MNIPAIKGIIRRRVLLNYRVQPEIVQEILPENFRPKLHKGFSIAAICLIRLEEIRPKGLPSILSISSENSAHRIAVEWDENGATKEGVFVPRRDTNSIANSLAGGRIFPGVHHHSTFRVDDNNSEISMRVIEKNSDLPLLSFEASETEKLPPSSIFTDLDESSRFFESGSIGYSSRPNSEKLDGLELRVTNWQVSPLQVKNLSSKFYDDRSIFPEGSIEFDHALLMRKIEHEWHSYHPPIHRWGPSFESVSLR